MKRDEHHTHRDSRREPARLGALEASVMDLLWAGDPSTIRELIDQLPGEPAYTTIATVLTNLRKKGLVRTRKDGYATRYEPCVRREEYAAHIMEHALENSGDREASMLQFVNNIPQSDIDLLRTFLETPGDRGSA